MVNDIGSLPVQMSSRHPEAVIRGGATAYTHGIARDRNVIGETTRVAGFDIRNVCELKCEELSSLFTSTSRG
jgi:hypothetical protein